MSKANGKSGEQPLFDFSRLSYGDSERLSIIETSLLRASRLQEKLVKLQEAQAAKEVELEDETLVGTKRDFAEKELAALEAESDELSDKLFKMMDRVSGVHSEVRKYFASVVTFLPDDWLVPSAPKKRRYDDPETFTHLRADKVRDLRQMIAAAQQPEAISKN